MKRSVTKFVAFTTLVAASFASTVALWGCPLPAQSNLFTKPTIKPQKTLGGLQIDQNDIDQKLESISGESLSPAAQLSAPNFKGSYDSTAAPQDGTRMFRQEPDAADSDSTNPENAKSVLNQSLPTKYRAETILPANIWAPTNSQSTSDNFGGEVQNAQPLIPQGLSPTQYKSKRQSESTIKNDRLESINRSYRNYSSNTHEIITERYPDGAAKIMRTTTQDQDGNYIKDGGWVMYNRQQEPIASGEFVLGAMQGRWERIYEAGTGGIFAESPFNQFQGPYKSTATFDDNRIDGTWTLTDRTGNIMCVISYKRGVRDGIAIWKYLNGKRMREATFKDGVPHGFVQQWDQQGKPQLREQYVDGRKILLKKSLYSNQMVATERVFRDRKLVLQGRDDWWTAKPATFAATGEEIQHGQVAEWYPNRQPKMTGQYSNGQREGMFTWWHPTHNKKAEGNFVNGKREGIWRYWHESGMKRSEGDFVEDKPDGVWRIWANDGKLLESKTFPEPVVDVEEEIGSKNESEIADPESTTTDSILKIPESLKVDMQEPNDDSTQDRSMEVEDFTINIKDDENESTSNLENIDAEKIERDETTNNSTNGVNDTQSDPGALPKG